MLDLSCDWLPGDDKYGNHFEHGFRRGLAAMVAMCRDGKPGWFGVLVKPGGRPGNHDPIRCGRPTVGLAIEFVETHTNEQLFDYAEQYKRLGKDAPQI